MYIYIHIHNTHEYIRTHTHTHNMTAYRKRHLRTYSMRVYTYDLFKVAPLKCASYIYMSYM